MDEQWKDIPGWEGLYAVSTRGRVRGLKSGKILKATPYGKGYWRVHLLARPRPMKNMYVHRAVAMTFLPNPDGLSDVHHLNEDKSDNRLENLQWLDRSTHMIQHTGKWCMLVDPDGNLVIRKGIKTYAKEIGVDPSSLMRLCRGAGHFNQVQGYRLAESYCLI